MQTWKGFLPERAVVMTKKTKRQKSAETLDQILADLGQCKRCKLHKTRNRIVFGVGHPKAKLVFVGEAPGEQEDLDGVPFVGRAGQLLTKMIEAIGLKREDVYICNVVKSRPPENRNPEPDEIEACSPFLFRQLEVIRPKLVVTLGKFASQTLLNTDTPISKLRGQITDFRGTKLLPTFHPAYLLRNPSSKREAWEDFKQIAATLGLEVPKAAK